MAAFGRAVVDASGGRRDQAPYTRFFIKITPSAAQDFGIGREIELGRSWLAELARNPSEALAQMWTPRLKGATDALEMAFNRRNDTVKALGPQRTSVVLFIKDLAVVRGVRKCPFTTKGFRCQIPDGASCPEIQLAVRQFASARLFPGKPSQWK